MPNSLIIILYLTALQEGALKNLVLKEGLKELVDAWRRDNSRARAIISHPSV